MKRFTLLFVVTLLVSSGFVSQAHADESQRATIGNREEPTETQLLAFAKGFCVTMRRDHDSASHAELIDNIDPLYLKEHGIDRESLRINMAPVGSIHNIHLADDRRTLLCYVSTGEGQQKEAILLRTVLRDGAIYLSPASRPAETTNNITPWILRMKL